MVLDGLTGHFVRKKAVFETKNGSENGQNERISGRKLVIQDVTPTTVYVRFTTVQTPRKPWCLYPKIRVLGRFEQVIPTFGDGLHAGE